MLPKASVDKNRLALSIAIADSKKLRFPLPELDKAIILLDRLEAAEKLREEMKEFIRNERIISTKTPEEVVSKKEHALRMIEDAKNIVEKRVLKHRKVGARARAARFFWAFLSSSLAVQARVLGTGFVPHCRGLWRRFFFCLMILIIRFFFAVLLLLTSLLTYSCY